MAKIEASIAHYLEALDQTDQAEDESTPTRVDRLHEKIATLRQRMQGLQAIGEQLEASPDQQVSLTDPDAYPMPTHTDPRGGVGYNVQAALDTRHHLIVAHEVTNWGSDRHHLATMARQAKTAMGAEALTVLADRGYYEAHALGEGCSSTAVSGVAETYSFNGGSLRCVPSTLVRASGALETQAGYLSFVAAVLLT
jgi:transposase